MPGQGWNSLQKKPPKPNKETIELSIYRKSEQVTRHPKRICVHENILQTLIFQLGCRLKSTAAWWEQGCPELPSKGTILSLWERIFQLCVDLLREFPVDAVHLSLWSTYPQNKKEYWLRSASRKSDIWTPLHQQHPGTGRDLKKLAPIPGWLRGTLQVDSEIWVPQAHQGSNVHTGELNCSRKDFLTLLFICILREFFKRWLLEPGISDLIRHHLIIKCNSRGQAWWHTHVMPSLGKLRQEDWVWDYAELYRETGFLRKEQVVICQVRCQAVGQ